MREFIDESSGAQLEGHIEQGFLRGFRKSIKSRQEEAQRLGFAEPADVRAPHLTVSGLLPFAHAQVAAQDREIDVLPFGAVVVPLDERVADH